MKKQFDRIKKDPHPEAIAIQDKETKRHKHLKKGWHVVKELIKYNPKTKEETWEYYVVFFPRKGIEDDSALLAFKKKLSQALDAEEVARVLNRTEAFYPW